MKKPPKQVKLKKKNIWPSFLKNRPCFGKDIGKL